MKKPFFSNPDEFSLSPLVAMMPVKGKLGRLAALNSSLYARLEDVSAQVLSESESSPEQKKRAMAEEAMLIQVLDWLKANEAA